MTLNVTRLAVQAKAHAGTRDWGVGPDVDRWLDLLVASINGSNLDEQHEDIAATHIIGALAKRLVLTDAQPIHEPFEKAPVVVTGLPRTGSTHLHRLLASQVTLRAPTLLECRWPVLVNMTADEARAETEQYVAITNAFLPELGAIHPIGVDEPEELYLLLEPSLVSIGFPLHHVAVAYAAALEQQSDIKEAWNVALRALNHLDDGRRWVLKEMGHLAHVPDLCDLYPTSVVVWLHRDPVEVVPSLCSLISAVQGASAGRVRDDLGSYVLNKCVRDHQAAQFGLDEHEHVIHVEYTDLLDAPMAVVEQVCNATAEPFDEAAAQAVLDQHPRGEGHTYAPEDFGLTADQIVTAFEETA